MKKNEFILDEPWFKVKGVAGKLKYSNPYYHAIANPGFGRIVDENGCVFGKIVMMNSRGFEFVTAEDIHFTVLFKELILA